MALYLTIKLLYLSNGLYLCIIPNLFNFTQCNIFDKRVENEFSFTILMYCNFNVFSSVICAHVIHYRIYHM